MALGRGVWDEGLQAILRSFLNAVRLFLCVMYLSPKGGVNLIRGWTYTAKWI